MRTITPQELEQIKKISVDMMIYFDKFCKEHNLEYAISYGTALGAKRHGGFIPWDDDVDVDMPIRDYNKFVKLWSKYGDKEKYFLQTKKTDPFISLSFHRLRKFGTTWIDPECERIPIHWGLPIDIFPVYNLPKSKKIRKLQRKLRQYGMRCCAFAWNNRDASVMKRWIFKEMTLLYLLALDMISGFAKKSEMLYHAWGNEGKREMPREIMFPAKPILFEGIELQAPARVEDYLEITYGDYMTPPPITEREGHAVGILDLERDSSEYTGCIRRNR